MELLNARLTFASMCTTFPSLMGFSKEMLSTEAVTTGALQCLPAARAAAISIQYMRRPPMRLPKTLVSFGKTSSVMMIWDSLAVFALICILQIYTDEGIYHFSGSRAGVWGNGGPGAGKYGRGEWMRSWDC